MSPERQDSALLVIKTHEFVIYPCTTDVISRPDSEEANLANGKTAVPVDAYRCMRIQSKPARTSFRRLYV
jgi:hypothetical protein